MCVRLWRQPKVCCRLANIMVPFDPTTADPSDVLKHATLLAELQLGINKLNADMSALCSEKFAKAMGLAFQGMVAEAKKTCMADAGECLNQSLMRMGSFLCDGARGRALVTDEHLKEAEVKDAMKELRKLRAHKSAAELVSLFADMYNFDELAKIKLPELLRCEPCHGELDKKLKDIRSMAKRVYGDMVAIQALSKRSSKDQTSSAKLAWQSVLTNGLSIHPKLFAAMAALEPPPDELAQAA